MGIVNVTPDSFSDGGTLPSVAAAVARAEAHVLAGATLLDIGGESTRPGSQAVDTAEQLRRVMPVLAAIAERQWPVALSIDTRDSAVAAAALACGAQMVNDVDGLMDPAMVQVVAKTGAHAIIMHKRGTPQTMQRAVHCAYDNVRSEVIAELGQRLKQVEAAGVAACRLWVDPGIGFAKSSHDNWTLTKHLSDMQALGRPIVYGASRKGFLGAACGRPAPDERDAATAAACALAVAAGAQVVRVHNVAATKDAVAVGWALRRAV
jgi:dihydropteroate synthase